MFDTMVLTKAVGALCGALLIFLVGKWVADVIYQPVGRDLPPALVIDTGVEEEVDEPVDELTFEEAFAMADASAGERLWGQCRACHALEPGRNGVGPYLHNVVGREVGAAEGFGAYSGALPDGEVWTPENLSAFIENPSEWAPRTTMVYSGMRSLTDRVNLIAYLIEHSPDYEAPEPAAVEEEVLEEAPPEEAAVEEPAIEEEAVEEEAVEEDVVEEVPAVEEEVVEEAPAVEEEAVEEDVVVEAPAVEEEAVEEEVVEEEADLSPIAAAFAEADVAAGQRVWNQCRACHVADAPTNRVGPHLVDIIGRQANSADGFRYSGRVPDVIWTLEELDAFLENPRDYAPGTSMAFNGLRDLADRANVLAYIDSLN